MGVYDAMCAAATATEYNEWMQSLSANKMVVVMGSIDIIKYR